MDNAIDVLMAGTEVARRLPLRADAFARPAPRAEHGFSALLDVRRGEARGRVLFDTGVSRDGILHNADLMEIDLRDIRAIVLSHGHADHTLGLAGLLGRLGPRGLPLVLHPEAYLERKIVLPTGVEVQIPPPRRADLRRAGVEVIEEVGPSLLVDDMVLVSGEVRRTTPFETGFPIHWARRDGTWGPDPLIRDDQCAIEKNDGAMGRITCAALAGVKLHLIAEGFDFERVATQCDLQFGIGVAVRVFIFGARLLHNFVGGKYLYAYIFSVGLTLHVWVGK